MALSIAGMLVVLQQRQLEASLAVAGFMLVLATVSAVVLALLLRRFEPQQFA